MGSPFYVQQQILLAARLDAGERHRLAQHRSRLVELRHAHLPRRRWGGGKEKKQKREAEARAVFMIRLPRGGAWAGSTPGAG